MAAEKCSQLCSCIARLTFIKRCPFRIRIRYSNPVYASLFIIVSTAVFVTYWHLKFKIQVKEKQPREEVPYNHIALLLINDGNVQQIIDNLDAFLPTHLDQKYHIFVFSSFYASRSVNTRSAKSAISVVSFPLSNNPCVNYLEHHFQYGYFNDFHFSKVISIDNRLRIHKPTELNKFLHTVNEFAALHPVFDQFTTSSPGSLPLDLRPDSCHAKFEPSEGNYNHYFSPVIFGGRPSQIKDMCQRIVEACPSSQYYNASFKPPEFHQVFNSYIRWSKIEIAPIPPHWIHYTTAAIDFAKDKFPTIFIDQNVREDSSHYQRDLRLWSQFSMRAPPVLPIGNFDFTYFMERSFRSNAMQEVLLQQWDSLDSESIVFQCPVDCGSASDKIKAIVNLFIRGIFEGKKLFLNLQDLEEPFFDFGSFALNMNDLSGEVSFYDRQPAEDIYFSRFIKFGTTAIDPVTKINMGDREDFQLIFLIEKIATENIELLYQWFGYGILSEFPSTNSDISILISAVLKILFANPIFDMASMFPHVKFDVSKAALIGVHLKTCYDLIPGDICSDRIIGTHSGMELCFAGKVADIVRFYLNEKKQYGIVIYVVAESGRDLERSKIAIGEFRRFMKQFEDIFHSNQIEILDSNQIQMELNPDQRNFFDWFQLANSDWLLASESDFGKTASLFNLQPTLIFQSYPDHYDLQRFNKAEGDKVAEEIVKLCSFKFFNRPPSYHNWNMF